MTQPIAPSFCSRCGTNVSVGAHFCTVCGNDVSGQQASLATAQIKSESGAPLKTVSVDLWTEQLEYLREATIGEYDLMGELGRGGMAAVYLAHDIALDRKVAIKVMSPTLVSGEGMIERFKREARTAASLSHPHIIPVYAVRETDRLLYFVMKFIAGRPLDGVLKELGPLPMPMIQMILQQVGGAFGYAHRRGIIHRDIKPANIMIDEEGWAVVTDFGIAKVSQAEGLTMTGMTVGTPTYMSPEQCMAQDVTGASDQYSLGVVAYEMITGRPPFAGASMMAIMYGHFNDAPPAIESIRPDCPEELRTTVLRMLEKDPTKRWPSLEDAVEAIGAPVKTDDNIRTQLVELAKKSENTKLLKRLSTPISPTPLTKRSRGPATAAPGAPRPATGSPRTAANRTAAATVVAGAALPAPRKRSILVPGIMAAMLAIAVAVVYFWPEPAPDDAVQLHPAPAAPATDSLAQSGDPASGAQPSGPVASNPDTTTPVQTARVDSAAGQPPSPAATSRADPATLAKNRREYQRLLGLLRSAKRAAVTAGATALEMGPGDDFAKFADRQSKKGEWTLALGSLRDGIQSFETSQEAAAERARLAILARSQPAPSQVTPETALAQRPTPAQVDTPRHPDPVVVTDERPLVEQAIREFARAWTAADLEGMIRVFPNMAPDQRKGLKSFFEAKNSMDTSRWQIFDLVVNGAQATAKIGGTSVMRDGRGKTSRINPPRSATLEKGVAGWRITSIAD